MPTLAELAEVHHVAVAVPADLLEVGGGQREGQLHQVETALLQLVEPSFQLHQHDPGPPCVVVRVHSLRTLTQRRPYHQGYECRSLAFPR